MRDTLPRYWVCAALPEKIIGRKIIQFLTHCFGLKLRK